MKKKWLVYIGTVLLLILFWYFRTWFQPLIMLFYTHPALIQAIVLWGLLHYFWFRNIKKEKVFSYKGQDGKQHTSTFRFKYLSYLVLLIFLITGLITSNIVRQLHMVRELEYIPRDSLPEAGNEIRLMPYEVAKRYARDSLQLSQYRLGTENIAVIDGRLSWVFPLPPDGFIIKFTLKNKGITYVDANTQERNSRMAWKDLEIGEGMQIRDNLWWNLYRERYFVHTEDPYYIPREGEVHTVVPAVSYTHHFRYGILYTMPRFAGSFLVDSGGNTVLLTHEEVLDNSILEGNLVFPERLARIYVQAYQYNNGIINRFFIHDDQIQIQDVSRENRQPFLMMTEEGLKWFISTEPHGASHGIFKIFVVDARTGRIELYELPEDQTLTGPVRAIDYVRRSNPVVDWSRFIMVEPLPFIRDGILYWKVAVIPEDSAGIAYQAFVDSRTNEVVELEKDWEIALFVAGETPSTVDIPEGEDKELIESIRQKIQELQELFEKLERKMEDQESKTQIQ